MLTFKQILDYSQKLVRGFTVEKMDDAVNSAQDQFASDFKLPFLVREYYVFTTDSDGVGPYTVYEDALGVTEADWICPASKPTKGHITGLVNQYDMRIGYEIVDGNQLQLNESSDAGGTLRFWCIQRPTQIDSQDTDTNYLATDTVWPVYAKNALCHLIASYLSLYKKDYARQEKFENDYRFKYAPQVRSTANEDGGIRNSGDSGKDDTGRELNWV